MPQTGQSRSILVAGATGYVGARLVQKLADAGHHVRAMGRSWNKLQERPWATDPHVQLVSADVLDGSSLDRVLVGVEVVYYLVHSMTRAGDDFEEMDRRGARTMASAAARAGVSRIIYLGGLGDEDAKLSPHLRSRAEVGRVLAQGSVPVTTLRAAIIIGAGSASFEILRFLTDRLPVMITPRWLGTRVQPIAIDDCLTYLVGCLDAPSTIGATFDIGGPERTTYRHLIDLYAKEAGHRKRFIVGVPVLTPRLSTYWIRLVTPAPGHLVRPLAEGLRNSVVCQEDTIRRAIPIKLLTCRDAIDRAIHSKPPAPAAWLQGDASWTTHGSWMDAIRKVGLAKRRARVRSEQLHGDERKVIKDGRRALDRKVVVEPDDEPILAPVDARKELRRRSV